jgi:uncharacterized protein YggE
MNNDFFASMERSRFGKVVTVLLLLLAAYLAIQFVNSAKAYQFIGTGVAATNTISVDGTGKIFAVPDIATFSVTVTQEKANAADAQKATTDLINPIIDYLKSSGIDEKDIQTTDYNISPRYEYTQSICTDVNCQPGKQTLKGFDATETVTVKVRDTSKAGDLLAGVGGKGATSVSGLSFTIDDDTALQAQARANAINDAKSKANLLASQLGVHLVRIVNFSESTGGYPMPYFGVTSGAKAMDSVAPVPPTIETGQNQITSNVSITYEIR